MKHLLLVLFVVVGMYNAHAQEGDQLAMMSGIVLNENNKLVPDAIIKIIKKKVAQEVRVGEDGMYYSRLLEPGSYIVDIYVGTKYYTAKRIRVLPPAKETLYYNFRLKAEGVAQMYTDKYDPLERLKAGERVPQ